MKKLNLIFILAIILFCNSCSKDKIWKDDELSIQRVDYNGTELKTNGYYYNKWGDPEILSIFFLYKNAVVLDGSTIASELLQREQEFINGNYYNYVKSEKLSWGLFSISGNTIRIEKWYPSEPPKHAFIKEGEILNDTTFVFKSIYRMKDGKKTEYSELNEVYHFKTFPNKPDSTNSFVK